MLDAENYLRGHQERAKVDWRRSALDRGHSRRLASKCPFVEGGGVKGGEVVMAEISRGDKLPISDAMVIISLSLGQSMGFHR